MVRCFLMDNKIKLYINTIKHLKPSQVYYRLSNRMKRKLYNRKLLTFRIHKDIKVQHNTDYLLRELDFNREYLDGFDTADILTDRFTFINISNQVDLSNAWNNKELQHLWRYNLHYFEYLFKIAYEYSISNNQNQYYDKFKYLIENWINYNSFSYGDGWHPYTVSLRLVNWISVYQVFEGQMKSDPYFDKKFKESMYLQYKYLQNNLEKDVLGNHYFENIKALIIGSIFFEEFKVKDRFKKELLKQLDEQILEDGMHFELSPMYHKIILEALIKITYWFKNDSIYNQLIVYIQKMIDVIYSLEENFGKTPAFNDSTDGISKDYKILLFTCKKHFNLTPSFKSILKNSGYYIVEHKFSKLIFDVGDMCPIYLPAHGHCDALSFELSVNNTPLIVNSGTYRYEGGKWRDYFRSTNAHNTVTISDMDQSQFWGSFRVAKRIKKVRRKQFAYNGIEFYAGAYVAYHGAEHKRYIGYIGENMIIILDYVRAKYIDNIKNYLHFVPGTKIDIQDNAIHLSNAGGAIKIITIGASEIDSEQGWYSDQFNVKAQNNVLILKKNDNKALFGYLIDLNPCNYEILELENELKIIGDKELTINYDELGDML